MNTYVLVFGRYGEKAMTVDENRRKTGMKFILVNQETGQRELRTYDYSESITNAINPLIFRIKGIRYGGLPETFLDDETGLPVISRYYTLSRK